MPDTISTTRGGRELPIVTLCFATLLSMTIVSCDDKLNVTGPDLAIRALQPVWSIPVGSQPGNFALDIEAAANGHAFVTGFAWRSDMGRPLYLFEVDREGNLLWDKEFTPNGIQSDVDDFSGVSVLPTDDGGCIAVGYGTADLVTGAYVVKVGDNGEKEWDSLYTGADMSVANCVVAAPNGDFVIGGSTFGSGVFMMRIDPQGRRLWEKTFKLSTNGSESEMTFAVAAVPNGGFLMSGQIITVGEASQSLYVIRTDENGDDDWISTLNEGFTDCGRAIIPEADGGCLVTAGPMPLGDTLVGLNLVRVLSDGTIGMRRVLRRASGTSTGLTRTADGGYIAVSSEGHVSRVDRDFRDLWAGVVSLPSPGQSVSSIGPDGTIHIVANTTGPYDGNPSRVRVMRIEPK